MPAFNTGSDFPLCPTGLQEFVISRLSSKDFNGNAYVDKNGKPQMRWTFETTEVVDENDEPFKVNKSTGMNYGSPGSFLTQLMDSIFPDLSYNERAALEIEDIVGTRVKALVYHQTTERGTFATFDNDAVHPSGKKKQGAKPLPAASQATAKKEPLPKKVDEGDPFEFDWEN